MGRLIYIMSRIKVFPPHLVLILIVLSILFVNCSNGNFDSAKDTNGNNQTQDNPPAEAPPEPTQPPANKIPDPWEAPVGDAVMGVTLSDGWYDLRIAEGGLNVNAGWTDSVTASKDGRTLYFSYSRFGFSELVDGMGNVVTGPALAGQSANHFKNFKAELQFDNTWAISAMPYNIHPDRHESSQGLNATQDLAAFSIWEPSAPKAVLHFSKKEASGQWSAPLPLPSAVFGTNCSNDNPFIVGTLSTTVDIYFESDRSDINCTSAQPQKRLYHISYTAQTDSYSAIQRINGVFGPNSGDQDHQPFITEDKKSFYWTLLRTNSAGDLNEYAVYTADLVSGAYVNARPIAIPNLFPPYKGKANFLGEPTFIETDKGYLMYMICGVATREPTSSTDETKGAVLRICRAKKDKYPAESKKINTAGWSDSPYISRDGQRLYFMYSRYDFSQWLLSGGSVLPKITGPDRLGLKKNLINPFDESDYYVAFKQPDGSFSEPVNLGLNGPYGDASGMEYNDGNSFIWLRGNGSESRIVRSDKLSDGRWGPIIDFGDEVNAPDTLEDNPHISADGNAIWFVSDRAGGQGKKDIWFSYKTGSTWSSPVNAGNLVNSEYDDDQPFISPDGNDVYWNGPLGIMKCVSNGSNCSGPAELVVIPNCVHPAEVSLPDDQQTLYFGCGNLTTGRIQIMFSRKTPGGSWGPAQPVD